MVFVHNDFYTASGTLKLYNCWTESVTKFDTSSFYNWEQDNLPVYDLEERTYLLWEKLGFPTSSIPNISMVVSAGGAPSDYVCNTNVYENICDALAALPEIINSKVIIEVCNKGDLGDLFIHNIKFGCNGSLEIVNKNFAKMEPYSGTNNINKFVVATNAYELKYGNLGYVSGDSLGVMQHLLDTKSEFLNTKIYPSITDIDTNGALQNLYGFCLLANIGGYHTPSYGNFTIYNTSFPNVFQMAFYESQNEAKNVDLVGVYDLSSYEEVTNIELIEKQTIESGGAVNLVAGGTFLPMVGLFYGNRLNKVQVTNCDGPIYVRNFFVDGSGSYTNNEYGFSVGNCNNVILENCLSIRNNKAGFFFNNSNVTLTRGIGAYRNYSRPRQVMNTSSAYESDLGAGLLAVNSNIQFSSTSAFEYSKLTVDPTYSYLTGTSQLAYGVNYPINFNRNANGIILRNSKLSGGIAGSYPTELVCDKNTFAGIRMFDSQLEWDGKLLLHSNDTGLLAENSTVKTDVQKAIFNQKIGVDLRNSNLTYSKNLNYSDNVPQCFYDRNGIHLNLNNSNYGCEMTSSVHLKVGQHKFYNSHRVNNYGVLDNTTARPEPSVKITNSSNCLLLHTRLHRDASSITTAGGVDFYSKKGLGVRVEDNSRAILKGSSNYATIIQGPDEEIKQRKTVGVYSAKNSSVDLQGPTVIARFAIDGMAEDNSILNITPHQENDRLQIKEFNLSSPYNHTKVELHSTQACLVANRNSQINLHNLGDWKTNWNRTTEGALAVMSALDLNYYADYNGYFTSGGHLQFYPNHADSYAFKNFAIGVCAADNFGSNDYFLLPRPTTNFWDFSAVTLGGMCVRAFENSIVNVKNVNFPCGWWNPSAPIFDGSAAGIPNLCSKLFVWNIADNSRLNANYCSVSSNFPHALAASSYHGPESVWRRRFIAPISFSGVPLALAPIATPDTTSISVLDYFGSGPVDGAYASKFNTSSFENRGPFRLFFSIDPAAYFLNLVYKNVDGSAGYDKKGWLYQIYSQGYQPPYEASADPQYASSIHKSLLTGNPANVYLSGFYYGSSMLYAPFTQRVILDESAANIFANAKHCSVGKSGLGKVVSIYYAHENIQGGEGWFGKDYGYGIRSVNTFDLDRNN